MSKTMKCDYCYAQIDPDDVVEHVEFHVATGQLERNLCEHDNEYRHCPYGYSDVACDGKPYNEHTLYKVVGSD